MSLLTTVERDLAALSDAHACLPAALVRRHGASVDAADRLSHDSPSILQGELLRGPGLPCCMDLAKWTRAVECSASFA